MRTKTLFMAVLLFFVAISSQASQDMTTYGVFGLLKRTGPVADYLEAKGCDVSQAYTGIDVMGSFNGKPWPGVLISSGANSEVFIPVSDEAAANGLCADQTTLLDSLAAVCKNTPPPPPYCSDGNGKCWPSNPQGKYTTLVPHEGIRTVLNIDPQKPVENVLSVKVEGYKDKAPRDGWPYGLGWGPTFVLRNATDLSVAQQLLNDPRIVPYAQCITALKKGTPVPKDGESCFEVTIDLNGKVVKSDAPPECPF